MHLLKEGCLSFKRLFEAETGFNPFGHMTIASACNRELRMNRMVENFIASERVFGWRKNINQSKVAMEWLCWDKHFLQTQAYMIKQKKNTAVHQESLGALLT